MKVTITIPPLTYDYLQRLVARGEGETIEDIVDHCFITGLSRHYAADLTAGLETIDF